MRKHKEKELTSTLIESIVKALMSYWGIRDPRDVLRECIKKREWFKGVVLSTTFFEGIGKRLLIEYFKNKVGSDKFERVRSTEQIIIFLYVSEIIDPKTYCKMMEVNKFRNDIVHMEVFAEPRLKPKKARKMIKKAIACLETLIEKLARARIVRLRIKTPQEPTNHP